MKVVSLNVGLPRDVIWKGRTVTTGIFKEPVTHRILMRALNLDGDAQADLSVHGGVDKAVYGYPSEHYPFWKEQIPGQDMPWGMFGENLTTAGLMEDEVNIGDHFRIGSAEIVVTQPRTPCYKLAMKFGRDDMIKRFLISGKSGFYFSVLKDGEVGPGDKIELIQRHKDNITVADILRLYVTDKSNTELMRRASKLESLGKSWREYFSHQLEKRS
jgi:MOSC domain-containing protein YiiM